MVLVYHLAPGFLSLLLTKERKDKSEEGRGMGRIRREREREVGYSKVQTGYYIITRDI